MNPHGMCQWCKKDFELNRFTGKIPVHRNPGDKYDCLGSQGMPIIRGQMQPEAANGK